MLSLLVERFIGSVKSQETSGWQNDTVSPWFVAWAGGSESDTGIDVNGYTILTSGPFWQGTNIIAGDIGRLTLRVEHEDGREDKSHPANVLLKRRPNGMQRAITFKETLQAWALLWGNGSAYIVRNARGEPSGLIPLRPDRTRYTDDEEKPRVEYSYLDGSQVEFGMQDILHISGLGDGHIGYSVINLARNTVGHNLALQKHGNRQFKNQARPSGVLETDGRLKPEARDNLRREWQELHGGLDNTGRIALLQEGIKFNATQISNGDAQWIDARRFSREEAAAWFFLPPHKLGAMESSSVRANLEEQNRDYWNSALSRWATKWEQECDEKLLSKEQKKSGTRQIKFDLGDLLRGDIKTRFEAYARGRQWGWLNVNEIRKKEGLPPIGDAGEEYLTPTNMTNDPSGAPAVDAPEQQPAPAEDVTEAVVALLSARLEELTDVESDRMIAASKRANFDALCSRFYEGYQTTLMEKLSPILGVLRVGSKVYRDPGAMIEQYCDVSWHELQASVAGHPRSAWPEQVALAMATWGRRREELVFQMTEEMK